MTPHLQIHGATLVRTMLYILCICVLQYFGIIHSFPIDFVTSSERISVRWQLGEDVGVNDDGQKIVVAPMFRNCVKSEMLMNKIGCKIYLRWIFIRVYDIEKCN